MTDARRITVGPITAAYLEIQQGTVLVPGDDYDALHAEAEALRAENARLSEELDKTELRALKFIHQCNAHVDLYRELKAERDQLSTELVAIKGQQPVALYWQDIGYPEPRKHGPYFGWPSESALRNVDGGAMPVPLYTSPKPGPDVRALVSADDVRDACANAVSVFAEETNADQCREVAEYMREVLLAQIAHRQAQRQ